MVSMVCDAQRERAAMELLEDALQLPSGERFAYIQRQENIDAAVRHRAIELLASEASASVMLRTGGAADVEEAQSVPETIGGYRILDLLGRGGMGAVYLAERNADDFEHRVAVKVIKPGALSDTLTDRFRRERQILAQLNHPHIARLYDGGETEQGQPYIVMEYVDGQTLFAWLDQAPRPIDQRIALFRQVASAVAFAHQNLVVHRDLTPTNILVTADDQAKLIDFGIARPHEPEQQGSKGGGVFSGLSLTPGFAAPERSIGAASNTLADVYSLGKVLGVIIGKADVPELSAIARKAAAEEPEHRYASAGDLIEDIDRYYAKLPVPAYSDKRAYKIRKFMDRERKSVIAAAALVLTLVVGLAGTGWSYVRAERERVAAEQRFFELRNLAHHMLFDIYDKVSAVPGTVKAREDLARTALSYLDALAKDESAPADVRLEVAEGYQRLAKVVGSTNDASLGKLDEGQRLQSRALAILRGLHTEFPDRRDVSEALAFVLVRAASEKLWAEGDMETALGMARKVQTLVVVDDTTDTESANALLDGYRVESEALNWMGKSGEALQASDAGLAIVRTFSAGLRQDASVRGSLATLLSIKASLLAERGKPDASISAFKESLAQQRLASNGKPASIRNMIITLFYLAKVEAQEGRSQAIGHADEALNMIAQNMARDANDTRMKELFSGVALVKAELLAESGRHHEAVALTERAISYARDVAAAAGTVAGARMPLAVRLAEAANIYDQLDEKGRRCEAAGEGLGIMHAYAKDHDIPAPDREAYLTPLERMAATC
ncbi:MAG: hypothetical protein CMH85_09420 [Novosphingobium sp.]|nr:hypothetical protein [Novosphingobium sp.]